MDVEEVGGVEMASRISLCCSFGLKLFLFILPYFLN